MVARYNGELGKIIGAKEWDEIVSEYRLVPIISLMQRSIYK